MLKNDSVGCTHQGVGVVRVLYLLGVEGAELQLLLLPLLLLGSPLGVRPEHATTLLHCFEVNKEEYFTLLKLNLWLVTTHSTFLNALKSLPWGVIYESIFQESAEHEKYAGPWPDINSLKSNSCYKK